MRRAHLGFREQLARNATVVDVSLEPFLAAGALLYQGPWVAERLVEFGDFLAAQPDSIHPVVREILRGGQKYTAVDAFAALQRLAELKALVARLWQQMDVLVVPTIGTTFTVDEVLAAPIDCNTMLGHYTHFGNLLDLVGVAVPLGVASRRPAVQRDAAWRGADRRHRAAPRRADSRRTTRAAVTRIDPSAEERV